MNEHEQMLFDKKLEEAKAKINEFRTVFEDIKNGTMKKGIKPSKITSGAVPQNIWSIIFHAIYLSPSNEILSGTSSSSTIQFL